MRVGESGFSTVDLSRGFVEALLSAHVPVCGTRVLLCLQFSACESVALASKLFMHRRVSASLDSEITAAFSRQWSRLWP